MTEFERIDRAKRAQAALDEFLKPAIDALLVEYTQAMVSIATKEPWEANKITKLAQAVKIADRVQLHIGLLVRDGEAATADMKRGNDIAKLNTEQRKWLERL